MNRRQLLCNSALLGLANFLPKDLGARPVGMSIVTTGTGKVRGVLDQGIHIFKGIPYGADTSATRFAPATPPKPWTGIRDAQAIGPQAPQPIHNRDGRSTFSPLDEPNPVNSEDCLHL